jgi:hypothetical protein
MVLGFQADPLAGRRMSVWLVGVGIWLDSISARQHFSSQLKAKSLILDWTYYIERQR